MRLLYSFLFYLILPFVFMRLWWRSRRLPGYKQRVGERMGFYPFRLDQCLWVHAVSVGEVIAAIPLIKSLKTQYPDLPMLVTTMTPTGAARVKDAFGPSVYHAYIPYDLPCAMGRFVKAMQPKSCVIIETELWPNLIAACRKNNIPVSLVNARLSQKSANGYHRVASLTREMLQSLAVIAANGQIDADRLIALGAPKERVTVTGNIKFDLDIPQALIDKSMALRESLGRDRFIWVAASTHEGEEEVVLAAHKKIREKNPDALLMLVPRHPDRFDAMAKLCEQSFVTIRRSEQRPCTKEAGVYLGDTMGELLLMIAAGDVTFMGGSLIPRGGHNMLEPGALGKPVLTGKHLFNFAEISQMFVNAKAMTIVGNEAELAEQLLMLMQDDDERVAMGKRALQVVLDNRGALKRQMMLLDGVITA